MTVLPALQVNVEDTVEMLPKSRRALTIQEIAALARSSLHGNCSPRGSLGKGTGGSPDVRSLSLLGRAWGSPGGHGVPGPVDWR